MKKFTALIVSIILCLPSIPVFSADNTPTLIVDMTAEKHSVLHGSAGFLYGISNEGVPDVNTLTPLKPKVLATKGALGTEHPYGDALDVADEFFEAGGEQVQMYCSNYYGVFGVTANAADYGKVLETIIAPHVAKWKNENREKYPDIDNRIVYIPINEGTPVNGASSFEEAWKIYYNSIKKADPSAMIAGPNDAVYRGHNGMYNYLKFCRDNNCLPDVVTWHELQVSCLNTMSGHFADYRSICNSLHIEEKQVVINEYADFADCGVPGRLVNWIARLEDNEVYGCLPFWHQANNLNDLAANANQGNGAWWVYKQYGDMSGQTLSVTAKNTPYNGFYGVAAIDDNKKSASVLCGGTDGEAKVVLDNISNSSAFKGAKSVHVRIDASYFTGYHGAVYEPVTITEGVLPVIDGKVEITIDNSLFSTAYNITVTNTSDDVSPVSVGSFRAEYEAENAFFYGNLIIDYQNNPIETPRYFCSNGQRIGGIDSENEGIEYNIEIPFDGLYKLSFIYGNGVGSTRNNADTHRPLNITQTLSVDGNEEPILFPNTLFYSMEGSVEKYVSLTKGMHSVALMYRGEGGVFHDALYVSYEGAYGSEKAAFNKIYEAEEADFMAEDTFARTEYDILDYSGSGYVTGLDKSSIRHVIDVEESGLYNVVFRYSSPANGKILLFLDNTALTRTNLIDEVDISSANSWQEAHTAVFLRQGINIIDTMSDCPLSLDYMRVIRSEEDFSVTVEAEDADGSFETSVAAGGETYVKEMLANKGFLEFKVTVFETGSYKMQVFQSNNDLCGTHSYNIKIIDRYASFVINGDAENAKRYFFPNTFSDDTFLEKTIPLELEQGENTIRIYNDDSWHVLWGGTTSTPGTNELVNYTPNFDKFIISPAKADITPDIKYSVKTSSTQNGYIYCDKNEASSGETVTVYLIPDGSVRKLTVNGKDITPSLETSDNVTYTAKTTVSSDTHFYAEFAPAIEGDFEKPSLPKNESVVYNGKSYKIVGENLFSNGDFTDNSGNNMDEWYVGVNKNGHPTASSYQIPKINPDGTIENLIPLAKSSLLTTGAFEKDAPDTFYYGADGTSNYLVEHMSSSWKNCAWNGAHSLLAFVPIKPDTKYLFRFRAYTLKGNASVRFGAVNMESFVPENYSESDSLNFSGSGYMSCTNGDMQNVGGAWKDYEAVIYSGDGDYFLFNAYWLQMAEYLCLGGFNLSELSDEPLAKLSELKTPDPITVHLGERAVLPDKITGITDEGKTVALWVKWLNGNIDMSNTGVYAVTGVIDIPDNLYFGKDAYIKQKIIVLPKLYEAEITPRCEGNIVYINICANKECSGKIFVSSKNSDGVILDVKSIDVTLTAQDSKDLTVTLPNAFAKTEILFLTNSLAPLSEKQSF